MSTVCEPHFSAWLFVVLSLVPARVELLSMHVQEVRMHFSYSCQRVSLSRPAREKSRDLGDRESCCRPLPSPWHETRSFPETIFRSMQGHHRIRLTAARGRVDGQDGLAGLLLTPGPSRRSREHGFVGPSHPLAHTLWMNPFPAPSLSPVGPPGHHAPLPEPRPWRDLLSALGSGVARLVEPRRFYFNVVWVVSYGASAAAEAVRVVTDHWS